MDFVQPGDVIARNDYERDQWNRPLVLPRGGTKKLGYTRSSSASDVLDDTYHLNRYKRRNTAYGMAYDPSLVARVIAVGGNPTTWGKAEKHAVNDIVEAADTAAKAHARADIGTAVHKLTERLDRGEDVRGGPYKADLVAYLDALDRYGLQPIAEYVEVRLVCDELKVAGTGDRIYWQPEFQRYVIGDVKTSDTLEFGGLKWAAQFAVYANSELYDINNDEVRPWTPPIDRTTGYLVHLPAGQGRCEVHTVNLVEGYRAAVLANEIRAIRKASKKWIAPAPEVGK